MRITHLRNHRCYFCGELANTIINADDTPFSAKNDTRLKLCGACACELKDILNLKTDEIVEAEG